MVNVMKIALNGVTQPLFFFFFFLYEITLVRCTHLISDTSTTYSCVNNVFWQFP